MEGRSSDHRAGREVSPSAPVLARADGSHLTDMFEQKAFHDGDEVGRTLLHRVMSAVRGGQEFGVGMPGKEGLLHRRFVQARVILGDDYQNRCRGALNLLDEIGPGEHREIAGAASRLDGLAVLPKFRQSPLIRQAAGDELDQTTEGVVVVVGGARQKRQRLMGRTATAL